MLKLTGHCGRSYPQRACLLKKFFMLHDLLSDFRGHLHFLVACFLDLFWSAIDLAHNFIETKALMADATV